MNINIENLNDKETKIDLILDYLDIITGDAADNYGIKYETLENLGFITKYKKKDTLDLEVIKKYFEEELKDTKKTFEGFLYDLIFKFSYAESDSLIDMSEDDILDQYENETEEDFMKINESEDLNVLNDNIQRLKSSIYTRSLEKYKIVKTSKDDVEILDNIKDIETYPDILRLFLTVVEDNGSDYNPVIYNYLKNEGIINE